MSDSLIDNAAVDEALNLTKKIIDEVGPRLPGSPSVLKAADMIHDELRPHADKVEKEKFIFAPDAFMGFFQVFVITFLIASIMLFFPGDLIYWAAVIAGIGIFNAISQFVFYWGIFDIFYPKKHEFNVIGVVEPDNPKNVKQEIIVCGHHDSAWTVTFFQHLQKLYVPRLVSGIVWVVVTGLLTIVWAIYYAATGNLPFYAGFLPIFAVVGFPFAIQLMFYKKNSDPSPGAGDNLISSMMAVVIGKNFFEAKKGGKNLLQNTRLKIISFGAEEAATKGSQAYAKRHKAEFKQLPIYALCPDCIYKMRDFKFLKSDQNGLVKTSPEMMRDCLEIAHEFGYNPKTEIFPFGGGATDAAPLQRAGVQTLIPMAMSTELIRDDLVQHTPGDVPEFIDREVVEATMKIMAEYILRKDKNV
jgi:hypothetical protein